VHRNQRRTRIATSVALALAATLPAAAMAQSQPKAELSIDVATHNMPGMPGMGGLFGRLAGKQRASYGMTRFPGMPGQYLDIALDNRVQPATPAAQAVPEGLKVGKRIDLLPPDRPVEGPNDGGTIGGADFGDGGDGKFRILYYWGCGAEAGKGQPREFTVELRDGVPQMQGSMVEPRKVADRSIPAERPYVLWPNPKAKKTVADGSSLVGDHQVTGPGVPDNMRFALQQQHDFLPRLAVDMGEGEAPMVSWEGVDGARAYFLHGMSFSADKAIVMWSSASDAYAGPELMDYLDNGQIDRWTKSGTLLPAGARNCQVPRQVMAATGNAPMLQMIAYGGDSVLAEPRPADASRDWTPDWTVRVRSKSTAMVMSGMPGMAAPDAGEMAKDAAEDTAKETAKSLLKGLFGN